MRNDEYGLLMDVPVQVSVELGRKTVPIAEVLQMGPGAIVELSKAAGESLDLLVNGKLVARGEAVVVGEKYGIRIVEVIGASELTRAASPTDTPANDAPPKATEESHVA